MSAAPEAPTAARFAIQPGAALIESEDGKLEIRRGVSIIVNGDIIEEIVYGPIDASLPRVEAPGDLLLPGFISGHTHTAAGTAIRGLLGSNPDRAALRPMQLIDSLSDEELDDLTAQNLGELLLSGCTAQVEMSLSPRQAESYVRVAEKWGARGFPAPMVPSISRVFDIWFRAEDKVLLDSEPETLREIEASLGFAKKHMGKGSGRIMPMIALHASDTQTPATMDACATAARELGTGVHMHLAQMPIEAGAIKRLWDSTPIQFCSKHGLLDGPFFGAHMYTVDFQQDGPLLASKGAIYATCPSAGGAGGPSQPYPEALAAGIKTNVGIDTHSNDYLENLKLAVLIGQARHALLSSSSPSIPSVNPTIWTAIEGATRWAADGLRRKDLGRIRKGAKADLVSIDVSGFHVGSGSFPTDPLNNLSYANGRCVRNVWVDGKVMVWQGRLAVADPLIVAEKGAAAVRKIWAVLEQENWFT